MSRTFLDTNVVVYAVDREDDAKRQVAIGAIAGLSAGGGVLSTQVLAEFYVAATRKIAHPLTHAEGARAVTWLAGFEVVPHDAALVRAAVDLRERAGISLWDALILRAAATAGCERVLTEDLNHGQVIDGVRIENPFV